MIAAVSFGLLWGLATLRAGRNPISLVVLALQHLQAAILWLRKEAYPAIVRSRERYRECLWEVRQR